MTEPDPPPRAAWNQVAHLGQPKHGKQPIVHTIKDGFCTVCGDTAEWLREQGHICVDSMSKRGAQGGLTPRTS